MIEVIYKEDTTEQEAAQESFSMPRNVRQIGLANGDYRIYIEDYVYTFLCSLAEDEKPEGQGSVAVLTGEIQWTADMTCIFIKGAIAADGMEAAAEHIDFSEKLWQKLQEDKDQYFPEQEIVGWFFAQPQIAMEITELFVKVHLRHFGGEKILMLMDPGEREDAFFRYDGGMMAKLSGYYIYYEKNSQMQTYMIERSQKEGGEASEKVEDRAVRNFRKIIDSKNPEERGEEKTSAFSYAATVCLALAVLVAGVGFYRNQQEKTEVPEDYRAASASVVQITPAVTEPVQSVSISPKAVQTQKPVQTQEAVRGTPAPTETTQKREKISITPEPRRSKKQSVSEATQKKDNKTEEKKTEEKKTEETSVAAENPRETYVIRPGDTLYQISLNRYGTVEAMEQICALNGISANEIIYPGQVIVLP
ncbi:MAG: LysM peptidoglycan-binding domain-containing protein [Blautia massiliensis]|uniref:LysM peptidoglycan-binding domain-containing protein n=2 Tax=Blautia massiliensis (ex Durand et al. 2017) TaxID=1737424 RepID=UPI0024326DEE|nr:LysM peptidoglycan-binding domain-containing protein [Blautia massiliensis (ex Durand et al. 2017)]MCI7602747.1 LysM peptidoglycan-binding domain-containing protein [Blautia massiliensis (ex Durand et al. 2017)]